MQRKKTLLANPHMDISLITAKFNSIGLYLTLNYRQSLIYSWPSRIIHAANIQLLYYVPIHPLHCHVTVFLHENEKHPLLSG